MEEEQRACPCTGGRATKSCEDRFAKPFVAYLGSCNTESLFKDLSKMVMFYMDQS